LISVEPFNLTLHIITGCDVIPRYALAMIMFNEDSEFHFKIWYEPELPGPGGKESDASGVVPVEHFSELIENNRTLKAYEFGLSGKPRQMLIFIFKDETVEAYVGPIKLVDSLYPLGSNGLIKSLNALGLLN
jgi:hypothetical protein